MNKIVFFIIFLILGCANKDITKTQPIEKKLFNKYQVSKDILTTDNNFYYFFKPTIKGITIYKIDKNLNLIAKKEIKGFIEAHKLKEKNNLYLLAYDEKIQKPVLIILDKNLKIKNRQTIGDKFDTPYDIEIDKNITILLQTYNNDADIKICNKNSCKIFYLKGNQHPKFIKKFKNGYLIIGSNQTDKEDLLLLFVKNNKIYWKKIYDFGYSDIPKKIKIQNNQIFIKVKSTDYMGAEKDIEVILNDKGEIIKRKKEIELSPLPTNFRT